MSETNLTERERRMCGNLANGLRRFAQTEFDTGREARLLEMADRLERICAAAADPWIPGPPTEPGVYVCQSELERVPRLWLGTVYRKADKWHIKAVLNHRINSGTFSGSLIDFVNTYRITHHIPIMPKEPEK